MSLAYERTFMSLVMGARWALVGLLLLAAVHVQGLPIQVRDDTGTEHSFPATPKRIVSLLPSLTESVFALGAGPRLVGVDRYSNWPSELSALPRLGGLDDAHIEAIAALQPDVVLASLSARSIDRLDALGFKVLRLKSETHADVRRTLELLGTLLGTPTAGERVWQGIQRDMAAAAQRVPPGWRGKRVYFEIGGGPYAAGRASFIGQTLALLGMDNIVHAELGPFPKLNPEFVVRAQPHVLMGAHSALAAMATRPGWQTLPAVAHQLHCSFDEPVYEMLIRPSPRMGEAAQVLAACLATLDTMPKSYSPHPPK